MSSEPKLSARAARQRGHGERECLQHLAAHSIPEGRLFGTDSNPRLYYRAMVVTQRTELGRIRLLYFLTLILATVAIVASISLYSRAEETLRLGLVALGLIGFLALALALLQLYA